MKDTVAESGLAQHGRRGPIDLPAAQVAIPLRRLLHEPDGRVSRVSHRRKRTFESVRSPDSRVAHPRDVSKHRARPIELAPEVEQHELIGVNLARGCCRRQIVRIPGVLVDRNIWRRVGDQSFVDKPDSHELLDVVLSCPDAIADPAGNGLKRAILDAVELLRRRAMQVDLALVPYG